MLIETILAENGVRNVHTSLPTGSFDFYDVYRITRESVDADTSVVGAQKVDWGRKISL